MSKSKPAALDGLSDVFADKKTARPQSESEASRTAPATSDSVNRIDGRSLRKTGRTAKFAVSVRPDWVESVKAAAARDGRLIGEVLEIAFDLYEKKHGK